MSKVIDRPLARIIKDCREADIPLPKNLFTRHKRVANKLNDTWGRLPTSDFLQDLIFPARAGRRGFPPEVAEEILALKNLHDARYANMMTRVWDPVERKYKDKSQPEKTDDDKPDYGNDTQSNGPSIYKTRSTSTPHATLERSEAVAQLMPPVVRKDLEKISASKKAAGAAAAVPAPAVEADELLLDAERLLDEQHINSGTALLELLTTLHPNYSPYTYLRLMEMYYGLKRREDYDSVCQRLVEQYSCAKIEWADTSETFSANLELGAQMFLFA